MLSICKTLGLIPSMGWEGICVLRTYVYVSNEHKLFYFILKIWTCKYNTVEKEVVQVDLRSENYLELKVHMVWCCVPLKDLNSPLAALGVLEHCELCLYRDSRSALWKCSGQRLSSQTDSYTTRTPPSQGQPEMKGWRCLQKRNHCRVKAAIRQNMEGTEGKWQLPANLRRLDHRSEIHLQGLFKV